MCVEFPVESQRTGSIIGCWTAGQDLTVASFKPRHGGGCTIYL